MKLVSLTFGVVAAVGLGAIAASAQEVVKFQATTIQPSAFKIKKAKAKGIDLNPTAGIELRGVQYLPETDGPGPAVVILVSGDGLRQSHLSWAMILSKAGYVALVVDSFGSRGGSNYLDTPALNIPDDTYSAYRYLSGRPYVDADRISLLGFSLGGSRLITTVNKENHRVPDGFSPVSAIAVYPECQLDGAVTTPLMILAGDADKLMSLSTCQTFVEQTAENEYPAVIHVYPGVTHFFDNPEYSKIRGKLDKNPMPLWFEDNHYDARAHSDAVDRILNFLSATQH